MKPYGKVAVTTELQAEDISQAATRATTHAIQAGATTTLCGKHSNADVVTVPFSRVVSCTDCTSALVNMRRAADHAPTDVKPIRWPSPLPAGVAATIADPNVDVALSELLSLRSMRASREGDVKLARVLANVSTWLLLGHEPHDAQLPDNTSVAQAGNAALSENTELCRFCGKHVPTPCDTAPPDVCEKAAEPSAGYTAQ